MPEFRTRECVEVAHPELILRFDDPRDEPYVARWAESIVLLVWDGRRLRGGDRLRFHGWPVRLVDEDGALAVHEDDLEKPADAPRFVPGVSRAAHWSRMQHELAASCGLPCTPVDARLATFAVCADAAADLRQASVLVRSLTPAAQVEAQMTAAGFERVGGVHASGWLIACHVSERCKGRGPHGAWSLVHLDALLLGNPDLVPFLGLPAGSAVEMGLRTPASSRVRVMPPDAPRSPEWNPLIQNIHTDDHARGPMNRFAMLLGFTEAGIRPMSPASDPSFWRVPLVLDPERDRDIASWSAVRTIMATRGVNRESASAALRQVMLAGRWEEWLSARHRDQFPADVYEVARAGLDSGASGWRLHNEVARQLHQLTGIAFVVLKEKVAQLDHDLLAYRAMAARCADPTTLL